ncbi:unannotated protein [freshwater metagenome]|uniref:Unannotated protein n=1 Tax=freshwater metagenome TaxID=449393 RepID=A0A6J7K0A6_9ZZZZ
MNTANGVTTGTSSGTGKLYWWNPALKGGCGYWQLAGSTVSVMIRYQAGSTSSRSTVPGYFSAKFGYTPTAGQPALPGTSLQRLRSGSIKLRNS